MQDHKAGFAEAQAHHNRGDHATAFAKIQAMIEDDLRHDHAAGMAACAAVGVSAANAERIGKAFQGGIQTGHDTWVALQGK